MRMQGSANNKRCLRPEIVWHMVLRVDKLMVPVSGKWVNVFRVQDTNGGGNVF